MTVFKLEGLVTGNFPPEGKPRYVYVASSWRNPMHTAVCANLHSAGINHYDFKNPPTGTGFSWKEVRTSQENKASHEALMEGHSITRPVPKGSDWEKLDDYYEMLTHERAVEGFCADFAAMQAADTFVMVLPCGKSAHLELGWAVGQRLNTAILAEDPIEPELMYRMVDYISPNIFDLLGWLGVED